MTIYSVAEAFTCFVEASMMLILCDIFCKRKENLQIWVYAAEVIAASVLIGISNNLFKYDFLNVLVMMAILFAMTFTYDGSIFHKAIVAILYYALIAIVEVATMFAITVVFDISVAVAVDNPKYRLLGIVLSKIFSLIFANAIRLKCKNGTVYRNVSYWILFFMLFFTSGATMFLLFKLTYSLNKTNMYIFAAICSFCLLANTFFALYLYEHMAMQAEIIRVQQQYEQNLKMELRHFDEMAVAQRQLKKFKHDFKNYVIGLGAYIDQNNVPGASEYLDSMKEKFAPGNTIIETGNPALDAMLSTKKAVANSKNIDFNTRIQIPENLNINSADLCVIFGNALDNAIEACERTKRADAVIDLDITYNANVLYCKIINTSPLPEEKKRKTSKTDKFNHGFGLENIKTALSKYHSEPAITHIGDTFTLSFIVFI